MSSWPLRALLEARALGVAVAQLKEAIWDCRRLLVSGNVIVCRLCIILSFLSVHCKCDLWNAFSAKCPDGRSVWRHVTRDGELRQTGSRCHGGLSGVLFWRCGLMIGSWSSRVLAGLGSPVRSWKDIEKLLLCAHKMRAGAQKPRRFRPLHSRRSFAALASVCTCRQFVVLLDLLG